MRNAPELKDAGSGLEACLHQLEEAFPGRVSRSQAVREQHGRDESWHKCLPPDAVVFPDSTDEVSQAVRICAANAVPVIAFGAGTALEGHVGAVHGGVSISFERMSRIIEVHEADMDAHLEAGVRRKQLNLHLRDKGLFFPIDPGADATFGGMAATRASGTNAVRYGTMRENVLNLTVVLADGRIIKTGGRARKSAAGYDLTRLFVGSEGTLGLITELTVRLHPIPEEVASAVCTFETLKDAVTTVIETMQSGVHIARIELLDALQLHAINRYSKTDYAEQPTLFLEFHGSVEGVREQAELVEALAGGNGGSAFQWATSLEERNRLWAARHDCAYASVALRPGGREWSTDVCVPISSLDSCILETHEDLEASGLLAPLVGHVGDGNFHLAIILDPDDPEEVERATAFNDRLVKRALALGGTCTGEHGIGVGKLKYLRAEHGDAADLFPAIKQALDPQNILNPGKIGSMVPA